MAIIFRIGITLGVTFSESRSKTELLTKTELFIKKMQEKASVKQNLNSKRFSDFIPKTVKSKQKKFFEDRDKSKNKSSAYTVIMQVMKRGDNSKKK